MTEKHSERGNVARMRRNEKSVRMKAQMPGPPGSAVSEKEVAKQKKKKKEKKKTGMKTNCSRFHSPPLCCVYSRAPKAPTTTVERNKLDLNS